MQSPVNIFGTSPGNPFVQSQAASSGAAFTFQVSAGSDRVDRDGVTTDKSSNPFLSQEKDYSLLGSYRAVCYDDANLNSKRLSYPSLSNKSWSEHRVPKSAIFSVPVEGMSVTEMRIEDYYLMRSGKLDFCHKRQFDRALNSQTLNPSLFNCGRKVQVPVSASKLNSTFEELAKRQPIKPCNDCFCSCHTKVSSLTVPANPFLANSQASHPQTKPEKSLTERQFGKESTLTSENFKYRIPNEDPRNFFKNPSSISEENFKNPFLPQDSQASYAPKPLLTFNDNPLFNQNTSSLFIKSSSESLFSKLAQDKPWLFAQQPEQKTASSPTLDQVENLFSLQPKSSNPFLMNTSSTATNIPPPKAQISPPFRSVPEVTFKVDDVRCSDNTQPNSSDALPESKAKQIVSESKPKAATENIQKMRRNKEKHKIQIKNFSAIKEEESADEHSPEQEKENQEESEEQKPNEDDDEDDETIEEHYEDSDDYTEEVFLLELKNKPTTEMLSKWIDVDVRRDDQHLVSFTISCEKLKHSSLLNLIQKELSKRKLMRKYDELAQLRPNLRASGVTVVLLAEPVNLQPGYTSKYKDHSDGRISRLCITNKHGQVKWPNLTLNTRKISFAETVLIGPGELKFSVSEEELDCYEKMEWLESPCEVTFFSSAVIPAAVFARSAREIESILKKHCQDSRHMKFVSYDPCTDAWRVKVDPNFK